MKVLLDENLPPRLAQVLRLLAAPDDHLIVHLRERFPAATTDVEWLSALAGDPTWAVLTNDQRLRGRPHEIAAWRRAGLVGVVLPSRFNQADLWEKCAILVRWWPFVVRALEAAPPGAMLAIPAGWGATAAAIRPFRRRR